MEKIESLQHQLSQLRPDAAPAPVTAPTVGGRRKISAAGIARIRAAQKARWAKVKAVAPEKPAKAGRRGPRKMSAAARAKIAAAQKARWAKVRAEKGA